MKKVLSSLLAITLLFAGINNAHAQKAPLSDSAKAAKKAARAEKKAAKAQAAAAATTTTPPAVTTPAVKPATVTPPATTTTTAPANAKAKTVTQGVNKTADKVVGTDAKGRTIYEGSKGGRYTLTAAGNKEYIKKTN